MDNYVYILLCSDNTLYTGWTNDVESRLNAHNSKCGAKYTKGRTPVQLVHKECFETKSEAMKRECEIKELTKSEKLRLIKGEKMIINNIKEFNLDKTLQCIKNKETVEFKNKTLILASASKARNDLLKKENIEFVVLPNTLDEETIKRKFKRKDSIEMAEEYVRILAKEKALTIAPYIKNGIILSADTVAFCENEILEKPKDESDARRIFNKISGSSHLVITGVCIVNGEKIDNFAIISPITMLKIPEGKIEELIKDKDTYSYAGGYRVDKNFYGYAKFAKEDFNNILGLPIEIIKEKIKCII